MDLSPPWLGWSRPLSSEKDRQTAKNAVARRFEVQPSGKLPVTLTLYLDRELVN